MIRIFTCRHRHTTRVFSSKGGGDAHVNCLDCGKSLAYDLERMRIGPEIRDVQPPRPWRERETA